MALTWQEARPAGDNDRYWMGVRTSNDGQRVLAISMWHEAFVGQGRIYSSIDEGISWSTIRPTGAAEDEDWYLLAMRGTGQYTLAGAHGGRLYLSGDYLATWTEPRPAGDVDLSWWHSDMSEIGQYMYACTMSRMYRSEDFGITWAEVRPHGVDSNQSWDIDISACGRYALARAYGHRLYVSEDFGVTWTEAQPSGDANRNWELIGTSPDGSHMLAGYFNDRIFVSRNFGVAWGETIPIAVGTNRNWRRAEIGDDGDIAIICAQIGELYISDDNCTTWEEDQPDGIISTYWESVAVTPTGSHFWAADYDGRLYYSITPPPEAPPTSTPLLISQFVEVHDSHDLVTRIYPRGGGVGDMRPSLADTTRGPVAGYTINAAAGYIESDAGVLLYGEIEVSPSWADISALSESTMQRTNAADMLFDRALNYLQARERVSRYYHVTVVNPTPLEETDGYDYWWGPPIYPDDLVLIDYYDATPDGAFIDVKEQLIVMSVDWRQDNAGRIAIELVLTPPGVIPGAVAHERTQGEVVAFELQQSRAARTQRVPR